MLASASDRLTVLVVGTNDLVNDLHGLHVPGRAPVVPALSLAVLGARAAAFLRWVTASVLLESFAYVIPR